MQHERRNPYAANSAHNRSRIGEKIPQTRTKRMVPAAPANGFACGAKRNLTE
jgi:hypothetical protein